MRIERSTRKGKEFAVIPVKELQKLIDDAEMLTDVKAYDADVLFVSGRPAELT